jgi:heme exporter protein A
MMETGTDRRGRRADAPGDPEGARIEPLAVELTGIAHRFGPRWVLRGCSLEVPVGSAVALLGSNGAGKTTLLKIIATLLRPKRGGGAVLGADLLTEPDAVRQRVGVLGHSPALYDDLTAAENLAFASRMRGLRAEPETITRVLRDVGLGAHAEARVRGFSSGMRRRVALGRILLHRPQLLLMDEPYASFDEEGIQLTHDLVRRVVGSGGAVVAATHDLPRSLEVMTSAVRIVDGLIRPVLGIVGSGPGPALSERAALEAAVGGHA